MKMNTLLLSILLLVTIALVTAKAAYSFFWNKTETGYFFWNENVKSGYIYMMKRKMV